MAKFIKQHPVIVGLIAGAMGAMTFVFTDSVVVAGVVFLALSAGIYLANQQ